MASLLSEHALDLVMYWLEKTKHDGCDKTKQGRDGHSKCVCKKLLNQVKRDAHKEENKIKKKGNGRYTRLFLNLAKITSLSPHTVNV